MENNYQEKYLYARGFLFTSENQPNLLNLNWRQIERNDGNFYFHSNTNFSFYDYEKNWVCIIGHCIDTINNTTDLSIISKVLFEKVMESEEIFYDYIERLSGRYAIVTDMKKQIKVYNDATGMQSIFYHQYLSTFGSHAGLVAESTNEERSLKVNLEWLKEPKTYHLPGHFTPYENIVFLLPNHYRSLNKLRTIRYFPRERLVEKGINDVIDIVVEESDKQLDLILKSQNILLSLTGGVDSRSTLSLLKDHINSIQFFTYYYTHSSNTNFKGSKSLFLDKKIVESLVSNLNLNHKTLPIDYAHTKDNDFLYLREILGKNTFLNHNSLLAKLYLDNFEGNDYLHLRSNIQEITRMFYRNLYGFKNENASFSDIVTCTNPKLLGDDKAISAFKKWLEDYDPNVGLNYDPFDILYWESRMGTWHSQLIIQSDIAFNTHILINSQYILKNMLSIANKNRTQSSHLHKLIERKWPVLSYWNINEDKTLKDVVEEQQHLIQDINSGISEFDISYSSGNINANVEVPYKMYIDKDTEIFYIAKNAPQKGDFVKAEIPIEKTSKDYGVCLELYSPYYRPKNSGRIKYQVFINQKLILEEDVAKWDQTNQIFIPLDSNESKFILTIQVIAIKDCESWNWGKAGRIQIKGISVFENNENVIKDLAYSSPHSAVPSIN